MWELELKEVLRERKAIKQQLGKLYALVMGQCTDAMVTRVEAHPSYNHTYENQDGIELLKIV